MLEGPTVEGFVYLRDQRRLTPEEIRRAQENLRLPEPPRHRARRVSRGGASRFGVYRPDGLWTTSNGATYAGSSFVRSGRPTLIEHLRLAARIVTGDIIAAVYQCHTADEMERVVTDFDAEFEKQAPFPDVYVRRYQDALCRVPEVLKFGPPPMLGEVGWVVNGAIVARGYLHRAGAARAIYEAGFLDPEAEEALMTKADLTVVEIGAGYGGLAYYLLKLLPQARYIIIDLPETLLY